MQQLSLFIFLIAFVPRLAVAQPVLSTHPPVHTLAMTGQKRYHR
jgi:hypothetical protein